MGGFLAQLQSPQSSAPAGKGAGMSAMQMGQNPIQTPVLQKMEKSMDSEPNDGAIDPTQGMMGGQVTMPGQGGQPQLGMPNAYSNTVSPWDNSVNQPKQGSGKSKGA